MARHVTNTTSAPSLAYAAVNTAIWVIYAALVIVAATVLRFHAPVAEAGFVLVAAAVLYPVRRRAARAANRRFDHRPA